MTEDPPCGPPLEGSDIRKNATLNLFDVGYAEFMFPKSKNNSKKQRRFRVGNFVERETAPERQVGTQMGCHGPHFLEEI